MGYGRVTRHALTAVLSLSLATVLLVAGTTANATGLSPADTLCPTRPAQPSGPVKKIAILGDSLTSASAGDYTWRYFMWKHLIDDGVNVDLLGPNNYMVDNVGFSYTNTDYVCDFDQDHAAIPGGQLRDYVGHVGSSLSGVDAVVMFAGLNDLYQNDSADNAPAPYTGPDTADELFGNAHSYVLQAQSANPNVNIVLTTVATVPQAVYDTDDSTAQAFQDKVRDYNEQLRTAVNGGAWSTATSKVVLAEPVKNWGGTDLTFDGEHPNVQGEVTIAAAIDNGLAAVGIGASEPAPAPGSMSAYLGPRTAAVLATPQLSGRTVNLSWTMPPGANTMRVQRKETSAPDSSYTTVKTRIVFASSIDPACKDKDGNSLVVFADPPRKPPYTCVYSDASGVAGHSYSYRIWVAKTNQYAATIRSNVVTQAIPAPTKPATVATPTATPIAHGVTVKWTGVASATGYRVSWRKHTTSSTGSYSSSAVVSSTTRSRTVTGLVAGTSYDFVVAALRSGAPDGDKSARKSATPAFYTIAAPGKPKLTSVSGHRFKATWTAKAHSTRYLVQYRKGAGAWKSLGYVTKASYTSKALTKGASYAVRIRPYDGTHGGGTSASSAIKIK